MLVIIASLLALTCFIYAVFRLNADITYRTVKYWQFGKLSPQEFYYFTSIKWIILFSAISGFTLAMILVMIYNIIT